LDSLGIYATVKALCVLLVLIGFGFGLGPWPFPVVAVVFFLMAWDMESL
jgi:hypothetical protein